MISEEQYRQLKQDYESAKAEADQAKGALAQLTEELQDEFGCANLKQAEAKLEKLTSERDQAEKDFQRALKAYEAKWRQDD